MQLSDLSDVLAADGPFVTVLVDATSEVEQAGAKYEAEWKAVLQRLREHDVPAPVCEALYAARGAHDEGDARLVIVSADAQVRLSLPLRQDLAQSSIDVGSLPPLLAAVEELSTRVPHVVVRADRTGADVAAYYDAGAPAGEVTVSGRRLHLTKLGSGGWSQSRYLHTVEQNWQSTARQIATEVASLAHQTRARLVVGVGDQRELALVLDALPTDLQPRWRTVEGGRTADGSRDLVQGRVAAALSEHLAADTLALLADYAQERGQDKRAVDGLTEVIEALRKAQVQTLVLTTDPDTRSTLWFGPEPAQLGTSEDDLRALGADGAQQGPLLSVLLRAALATGADVQLVPHQSTEAPATGLGALLRYADHGAD